MGDSTTDTEALLLAIGKLQGSMDGMHIQLAESNNSMNRRIDDLAAAIRQQSESLNRRIDDHQDDVNERFKSLEKQISHNRGEVEGLYKMRKQTIIASSASSGTVSAIVVGGIEIIKALSS